MTLSNLNTNCFSYDDYQNILSNQLEEQLWKKNDESEEFYYEYLKKSPKGGHSAHAKAKLEQLIRVGKYLTDHGVDVYFSPDNTECLVSEQNPGERKKKEFPEFVFEHKDIKKLSLAGIDCLIPASIDKLTNLVEFDASYCNLDKLPDSFGNLHELKKLNLTNCGLSELPITIGNLNKLEILDISSNIFRSIPESLGNLINLHSLDITGNPRRGNYLIKLPNSLGKLINLSKLAVQFNYALRDIPDTLDNLTQLNKKSTTDLYDIKKSIERDHEAWYNTMLADSIDEYQNYIHNFNLHRDAALRKIETINNRGFIKSLLKRFKL